MTNNPHTNTKALNVLLVPDSYKGSLSSIEVASALAEGIYRAAPDTRLTAIPMADGGEGTVDALVAAANGERHELQVTGPEHLPVTATYGQLADGAVIEMAAAAGLPLTTQPNPETTTTYGVGQLIDHLGDQNMMIGAGGSATNDLGCGAAAACGVTFYDVAGQQFVPTGATLSKIASIDMSQMRRPTELTVMTDIDNPLLGDNGAAAIFAPQKGADPAMVQRLERGAAHAANIIARDVGVARRTDKPVIAIVGSVDEGARASYDHGITAVFGITPKPQALEAALADTADNLTATAENIMRTWLAAGGGGR